MLVAAGVMQECCKCEQQRMIAGKCTYYYALHVLLAPHAATYILLPNVAYRNGYMYVV